MAARNTRPLSRARAASCVLINLAATPGLGSLMARRIWAGTGQLLLALAGFGLIVGWMVELFSQMISRELGEPVSSTVSGWLWKWGVVLFGASWLWSLVTSFSLWREAKAEGPVEPKAVPPRMADLPGQPPKLS